MRGPKTSLILVSVSRTSDSMMGWTETLTEGDTLKGYLRNLSGSERLASDMTTVVRTHRFYCDYDSNISEDDRFKSGSTYYDIVSINDVGGQQNIYQQVDLLERK